MYTKEFTRDYTMISEEIWFHALTVDVGRLFGIKTSTKDFTVSYFNNGVIELWTDEGILNELRVELNKEAKARPEEFNKLLDDYLDKLKAFQPFIEAKKTDQKEVLDNFVAVICDILPYFVIMYYIAEKSLGPNQIRERAEQIRREDVLFADMDKYLRNSLVAIYPHLAGLETIILKEDLGNMPSRDVLEQRFKNFVMIPGKVKECISLDVFAANNKEYSFDFPLIDLNADKITGTVAFPGKAQGRVRIITRNNQIASFQAGEILVSPMTTPDYLAAMKISSAIITDEGGTLCHAAIIARELKKPCVIGTKTATQMLKDGDMVEVDAHDGVVRIIK